MSTSAPRSLPAQWSRRSGKLAAAAVLSAGLAVLAAGCGGSSGTDLPSPPTGSGTALPTALPTALTSATASIPGIGRVGVVTGPDALRGTNIPPDFPVPPGATVAIGATSGRRSTLTLKGVSSDAVAAFYRRTLPPAGYKITSDADIPHVGSALSFSGHGVTGTIAAGGIGSADRAAVLFEKG